MNIKLKKHINITVLVTFLVVVILSFFIIIWLKKEDPIALAEKSFLGKEMTVGEVFDINSNEDYAEKIKNGKVLLVYLVSGCDACKKEIQLINETNKESDSEIKIFGIMFEKSESVNEYIKKQNINFPILIDKDGKLIKALNLQYFPANFILENGVIERASFGSPRNQQDLSELIISKR